MADALQPYREALAKRIHTVCWDRNRNPDSPIDTEAACRIERFLPHLVKAEEFLARHLGRWVFCCLDDIRQQTHPAGFYRAAADALVAFLEHDQSRPPSSRFMTHIIESPPPFA